jgi:hypothetical protein
MTSTSHSIIVVTQERLMVWRICTTHAVFTFPRRPAVVDGDTPPHLVGEEVAGAAAAYCPSWKGAPPTLDHVDLPPVGARAELDLPWATELGLTGIAGLAELDLHRRRGKRRSAGGRKRRRRRASGRGHVLLGVWAIRRRRMRL